MMIYPSKKDLWIVLIVVATGLILFWLAGSHIITRGIGHLGTWITIVATVVFGAIIGLFAYPVYYKITASSLLIQSGLLMRYEIPLSSIKRVQPTRNPLSAPAWSLDRLRIDYKDKDRSRFALISPKDKEAFLRELVHMAKDFELRGNEIVRVNPL
jgi:membrane protein YdbS with pleckstrin-like domain